MKIISKWPKWSWVCRHAENSRNDILYVENHIFPHLEPIWYCNRNWGPQEYIKHRLDILKREAEDLQKLINLFQIPEAKDKEVPLLTNFIDNSLINNE